LNQIESLRRWDKESGMKVGKWNGGRMGAVEDEGRLKGREVRRSIKRIS